MELNLDWFQLTPLPSNVMHGSYDLKLVALSYVIAVLAAYVALDFVGRLQNEKFIRPKIYWLLGGAFAMGAGIWSMHFIGMLAFIMPMKMEYDLSWTISSLLVAMVAAGFALYILREKDQKFIPLMFGGIFIGLGIATMHYMGMEGMRGAMNIHYLPGLFFASIVIALLASEAALLLALKSNQGTQQKQIYLKIISALIMGIAICGMHYTGMAAAVFTPTPTFVMVKEAIQPEILAIFVAGIAALIISLALTASSYYSKMVSAVQNEKEFLSAMLNNLDDGIIACDKHGQMTVVNDVIRRNITNKEFNANQILSYLELYVPGSQEPVANNDFPLKRALRGEVLHPKEYILKFKDSITLTVVIGGQRIVNAHGLKLGAVIAIHDISEIKETEKMKNEFVSVVSHELRTPLTSIRGSLSLLLGGVGGNFNDKAGKLLDIANKNSERLLLLINDILDIEKIQSGQMKFDLKIVDLEKLLTEILSTNKIYAEKYNVNIQLTEVISNLKIMVDPNRLSQVVVNLISNAAKFSLANGTVSVKMKMNDNKVRVCVTDNGPGIPTEFKSRIFQKFSQADSSSTRGKGGTGLGLNISKAIIEKLGGELHFKSEPFKETTFYFDLPVYQIGSHFPTHHSEYVKDKILICEDNQDQALLINQILDNAGMIADIAISAKEAKELLDREIYQAIILNLLLPDQDGISFIRELRQSDKNKKLQIIISSIMENKDQNSINGDALLIIDWLTNPVNNEQLLNNVIRVKQESDNTLPNILHVEDDLDMQHVIATLLEHEANVSGVTNIKESIGQLANNTFDLVILDLALPDGNGVELIPIFAKYQLPIIVYSAYELDDKFAKYVNQALVKSHTTNIDLLSTIKKLLGHSLKNHL